MSAHAYDLIFCVECGTIRVREERRLIAQRARDAPEESSR